MPLSLSACTKLQTLSIYLDNDFKYDDPSWKFLETVNSTKLERIKFYFDPNIKPVRCPEQWKEVDESLCKILDKNKSLCISFHPTGDLLKKQQDIFWECLCGNLQNSYCEVNISQDLKPEYPDELKAMKEEIN